MLPTSTIEALAQIRSNYEWMINKHLIWQNVIITRRADLIPHIAATICYPPPSVLVQAVVVNHLAELEALVDVLKTPDHSTIKHCIATNNRPAFDILTKYDHVPSMTERSELVRTSVVSQNKWAFDMFLTPYCVTTQIVNDCLACSEWSFTTKLVQCGAHIAAAVVDLVRLRNYPMLTKLWMCLNVRHNIYKTELAVIESSVPIRRLLRMQAMFRLGNVHLEFHR